MVADKSKPCEIYKRMCREKHVLAKKMFTNGLNCLKKVKIVFKIQASTSEMVDSVNVLILADVRVSIEDIFEKPGISMDTT